MIVCCAVIGFGVLGPYFFEENGLKVTVNSDRYCHMIETFLRPNLNQLARNHVEEEFGFQQDGAIAHTSRRSLNILSELFLGRLLSLRGHPIYHLVIIFYGDI